MMKIGILFLIDRLALGGTEKQLVELMRRLDLSRFQPHLATLHKNGSDAPDLDVPTINLGFRAFHHPTTAIIITRLSRYIRKHRIQILHTFFQDPTLLAALSRCFHKARLIGSFRDLGFWRSPKETFKMQLAYKMYDGFIANSKAVKHHFADTDGIHSDKIEVIYNGINIPPPSLLEQYAPKNHTPMVGIVANLNRPVKRVQDFILAAAQVHQKVPQARFVVVGEGGLRPQMEELTRSLGLDSVVTFMGLVHDPIKTIARFHVGVITSESEGFSNAILEYMACGVPVIATASGGNLELIDDGKNGFLVPVGEFELFAEKIISLLRNVELCNKIKQFNLCTVKEKYSQIKMVTRYQAYYSRLTTPSRISPLTSIHQ